MKTIFDQKTKEELIQRVNSLSGDSKALWGKMDVYQMVKHCTLSEEMFHGKKVYKRLFIGKLFGKSALKGILKNDEPLKRNQPTHSDFKIKGNGKLDEEQKKWISLLREYETFSNPDFIHPFFGKMTEEDIGKYVYKHTDHHLRQFGV